jgi:hypothetical protein
MPQSRSSESVGEGGNLLAYPAGRRRTAQTASSNLEISNWRPTNEIDSRSNPQAFLTDDLVIAFPYACACARELKSKSNPVTRPAISNGRNSSSRAAAGPSSTASTCHRR